jgi:hypothetical protein
MTNRVLFTYVDRTLGVLGLFLLAVVIWLADREDSTHQTAIGRLTAFLARRAIDAVAVIGWLVDRLPLPATCGIASGSPPAVPLRPRPVCSESQFL